jgi:hypothetical protein
MVGQHELTFHSVAHATADPRASLTQTVPGGSLPGEASNEVMEDDSNSDRAEAASKAS